MFTCFTKYKYYWPCTPWFIRFSFFHIEYQPTTGRGLTNLLTKHYRNQALFQLHTIIFGLDALGNPVSVVRGVVEGAVDLFYEPIKVSIDMLLSHNSLLGVEVVKWAYSCHNYTGKCARTRRILSRTWTGAEELFWCWSVRLAIIEARSKAVLTVY